MQLALVALGCGAAFQIGHIAALVGNDQRALKLARVFRIDAEIGRQFHRAAHPRRDIDKRAVREYSRIKCRIEIILHRHNRAEVFFHQFGVVLDRFRNRAKDHARFQQLVLKSCANGH